MNEQRLPYRLLWRHWPVKWKVQLKAPKKTWAKQIEADLKNQRFNLPDAKRKALNCQAYCKKKLPKLLYKTFVIQQQSIGYGTNLIQMFAEGLRVSNEGG